MHRDSSFECEYESLDTTKSEEQELKLRTKDLMEMASNNMQNWEVKVLDLIKYDYSQYIL